MEQLSALFELATAFHSCRDVDSLTKTLAAQLGKHVAAPAVLVWFSSPTEGGKAAFICRARWFEPGARFSPAAGQVTQGILMEMGEAARARRLAGAEISHNALAHLTENDRERITSALYAPIPGAGVIEILNHKSGKFGAEEAAYAEEAGRIAARLLTSLRAIEEERTDTLGTIERLTSLYDLSRIFNSTLEIDALLPIVTDRIRNILDSDACNLWLVDAKTNELYVAKQAGEDPSISEDDRTPLDEGPVGQVASSGQARLVEDAAEDEELSQRTSDKAEDFSIRTWMCAPLLKDTDILGAIEVINHVGGRAYNSDDLFFLRSVTDQAAIALNNANLLEAERKVDELAALLTISKEITSTLNLDHILTTVVHQAATVIPFDRCAIGLWDRSHFILGAVSGESEVPKTREMDKLRDVLEWAAGQSEAVSANQYEDGWETTPESGEPILAPYLKENESSGFYALPLHDEQGKVGVLALISGDAEFLTESQMELLTILANQTTVAIRNARLYNEVPLMSFWQPLVERKQKLQAMRGGRWLEIGWKVALVVLALVVVPWKMRITANATLVPAERRAVSAEVTGVVRRVLVHEGDRVTAGTVLAELDDGENRVKLASAQADFESARRQQAEAEDRRDAATAGQARLKAEMHAAELALYKQLVEKAQLRAPINGVVVTSKVEEKAGSLVTRGDRFCELVDQAQMAVEMNVPETQVALVQTDGEIVLKLNSFPVDSIRGRVVRVSAQTIASEGEQFFVVRALVPNPGEQARPGMVGRAKITASGGWGGSGWYPIGYVFLRDPARWLLQKIWLWLP